MNIGTNLYLIGFRSLTDCPAKFQCSKLAKTSSSLDTIKTRQEHKAWKEWRASELECDIEYCHPRWPQEAQYVNAEIKAVRGLSIMTGSDHWIYFDWVALAFILATILTHVGFFHYSTNLSKDVHHYITMPLLLILWFRLFKYARSFEGAGPFIVIFGSVIGDIIKWGFFNVVIFIPFACAFWMTFGSISTTPVGGYDKVGPLFYNIFSMMVGHEYRFEYLERTRPFMARLLCGSFIAIAAIVTLNLLIALLTNTFERLYENAVANAVMQRARSILLLEKSLWRRQEAKYCDFINKNASPEIISKNIGRLLSLDRDEATIERVRDDVKGIVNTLAEKFGKKFGKGKKSDLDFVKMDVSKVRRFQEEIVIDVRNMKLALDGMKGTLQEIMTKINNNNNSNNNGNNNDSNGKSNKTNIKKQTSNQDEDSSSSSSDDSEQDNSTSSDDEHHDDREININKKTGKESKTNKKNKNSSKNVTSGKKTSTEEKSSKTSSPKKYHKNKDKSNNEAESPNKAKPNVAKKPDLQLKSQKVKKPQSEPNGPKNSHIGELRKKFEENTETDINKTNLNEKEIRHVRCDKHVKQINENFHNTEYDNQSDNSEDDTEKQKLANPQCVTCQRMNTIPDGTSQQPSSTVHDRHSQFSYQQSDYSENDKERKKLENKPWPLVGMCQQMNTIPDSTSEQPSSTVHDSHSQFNYQQSDHSENDMESQKLAYPPMPLVGMCQQMNTIPDGTSQQPSSMVHDRYFQFNYQKSDDSENDKERQKLSYPPWPLVGMCEPIDTVPDDTSQQPSSMVHDRHSQFNYQQSDDSVNAKEKQKLENRPWPLIGMCQQMNTIPDGTFQQHSSMVHDGHSQFSYQQQMEIQKQPVKQELQVRKEYANTEAFGSETPISYVQIGKNSQFSCAPTYSSPKRNTTSFNEFDTTNSKIQTQNSCESCKCCFKSEDEMQIPTTYSQVDDRKKWTSAHYDGSLWTNSEDTTDKQQNQVFSSTSLHFNDDTGCCSHDVEPEYSSTRLSGLLRAVEPTSQTRNENIGIRCKHPENAIVETPCVERIYQKIPAINLERVSQSN